MSGLRRYGWVLVAVAATVFIVVGLGRGEFAAVLKQADTLCTACIGLTAGH